MAGGGEVIRFFCERCSAPIRIKAKYAGLKGQCRSCGQWNRVPRRSTRAEGERQTSLDEILAETKLTRAAKPKREPLPTAPVQRSSPAPVKAAAKPAPAPTPPVPTRAAPVTPTIEPVPTVVRPAAVAPVTPPPTPQPDPVLTERVRHLETKIEDLQSELKRREATHAAPAAAAPPAPVPHVASPQRPSAAAPASSPTASTAPADSSAAPLAPGADDAALDWPDDLDLSLDDVPTPALPTAHAPGPPAAALSAKAADLDDDLDIPELELPHAHAVAAPAPPPPVVPAAAPVVPIASDKSAAHNAPTGITPPPVIDNEALERFRSAFKLRSTKTG